ncbi:unnamed protein product [Rotaria magnacalcarata]|nr:unnamed protein product [Rotaria magnacalcarata]CAF4240398.1 unnamed protein product [Rotaria magnacalcarata]CAF4256917.1 unnamed protein product [Rotaria magnacalcarata]
MNAIQKDRLCEGNDIQEQIHQFNQQEKSGKSSSLKRHHTNHSQVEEQSFYDRTDDNENDDYQQIMNHRDKKKMKDKGEKYSTRTITNSNSFQENTNINNSNRPPFQRSGPSQPHQHQQQAVIINNNNNKLNSNNQIKVSHQALKFAAENHLQPLKFVCEPRISEQKQSAKLIQDFFKFISTDFSKQNPTYLKPLGFDVWWVDRDGNIQALTKHIDLYVYLCKEERYPKEINNIKITPHTPKHLPTQRSTILKWINNTISFNELKNELSEKYKSIYSIEEILGTANERNRHVRVDFSDQKEYNDILNSGKITIYGQLYDVDEYLPAPKLLICTKCNQPGHTKKLCSYSLFEICRRCGKDRKNEEDHKTCQIKCHNCQGDHTSTDYKCPTIQEYRRNLVIELRKRPDILPVNAQIFIPSECRQNGEKNKIIENKLAHQQQQQQKEHQFKLIGNDYNVWPILQHNVANQTTSSNNNNNIYTTITSLRDDLDKIKKEYTEEQRKIHQKYTENLNAMNQSWLIMQQQVDTQTQMVTTMNDIIGSTLFTTCSIVISSVCLTLEKMKNGKNNAELDGIINVTQQQLTLLNNEKSIYLTHQSSLQQLLNKQKLALNSALSTIIQQQNE